jgi:hypothetical protein
MILILIQIKVIIIIKNKHIINLFINILENIYKIHFSVIRKNMFMINK